MFSWRKRPSIAVTPRSRSIPVPLVANGDGSEFKNSSTPQPESGKAVPEFSQMRSSSSFESLRKFVQFRKEPVNNERGSDGESGVLENDKSIELQDSTVEPNKLGESRRSSAEPSKFSSEPAKNMQDTSAAGNKSSREPTNAVDPAQLHELKRSESSGWLWSFFRSSDDTTGLQPTAAKPGTGEADQIQAKADLKSSNWWSNSISTESGTASAAKSESKFTPLSRTNSDMPKHSNNDTDKETSEIASKKRSLNPSIVLPSFSTVHWPSKRARLANLLWSSSSNAQSLSRTYAYKPKRAVVIGVHGYFPARMTRRILGEPTGTSVKFANEADERLRAWLRKNGEDDSKVQIDKIALEGEGKVGIRISMLYDSLMNWKDRLVNADFVFFAVHSQGAVVTAGLIARSLEEQLLNIQKQHVSVLAMAGSWLGPMPGMDETFVMKAISRIEHDSLLELFESQKPTNEVSEQLQHSLVSILDQGVKICLVGSVDDQLIPLYSASAINVSHPNSFRAVYIDGEDVLPQVVAPLLQLAIQQLNLGHTDHGVIVELSTPLAGALTSKGHSKLYNHDAVYDLGLDVALQTQRTIGVKPEINTAFKIPKATNSNPYRLPWTVQSLISDSRLTKGLEGTSDESLAQFRSWKPQTKAMKDLKWRLVGLSSSKL